MEPQLDVERARYNMVEQQIRPWEVLDLLLELKREEFVPPQYRSLAFVDMEIPIGHGEKMLAPRMEARMLQELVLNPGDRILEVGTGSGYMTALLARLGGQVYSVDIVPEFTQSAAAKLASHGISSAMLATGDAARGWDRNAPYDAIVLTGAVPVLPEAFQLSLAPGGRLLAIVGEPPVMEARLVTCVAAGAFSAIGLFETCIAPLRNAAQPARFAF